MGVVGAENQGFTRQRWVEVARQFGADGAVKRLGDDVAVERFDTEVIHGVFEEGGGGENRQADGRAGEGAGDGEGEASGFAEEG